MIKDARGRRVPLIRHELLIPGLVNDARFTRLSRAGETGKLTRAEVRRFIGLSLLITPAVVAIGVLPPMVLQRGNWLTFLVLIPAVLAPALLSVWVTRRATSQRIADTYARAGLCGTCGYELREVPADAHGLRTCPECGAAWRLS